MLNEETISYHCKVSQTQDLPNYLISWSITLTHYLKKKKKKQTRWAWRSLWLWHDVTALTTHFPWLPSCPLPALFHTSWAPDVLLPGSCLSNPSCPQGNVLPCLRRYLHPINIFWRTKQLLSLKGIPLLWGSFIRRRTRSNLYNAPESLYVGSYLFFPPAIMPTLRVCYPTGHCEWHLHQPQ